MPQPEQSIKQTGNIPTRQAAANHMSLDRLIQPDGRYITPSAEEIKCMQDLRRDLSELTYQKSEVLQRIASDMTTTFGFERVIYWAYSSQANTFCPEFAMGSVTPDEHWQKIRKLAPTKQERRNTKPNDEPLTKILEHLVIPAESDSIFLDAGKSKQDILYDVGRNMPDTPLNRAIATTLKAGRFILSPVFGRNERLIGLWYIDNAMTCKKLEIPNGYCWDEFNITTSQTLQNAYLRDKYAESKVNEASAQTMIDWMQATYHNLRNPLTVIGGFAARLLKIIPKDSTLPFLQTVRKYTEYIEEETTRAEDYLRDCSGYNCHREYHPQQVDLGQLVNDAVREHQKTGRSSHVQIIYSAPQEQAMAYGDPELLSKAIGYVIADNKQEFSSLPGAVAISVSKGTDFRQNGQRIPSYTQVIFYNVGRVVPAEACNTILNPAGGSLKLGIAQKLLGLHGGTIYVETNGKHQPTEQIDYTGIDKDKNVRFRMIIPDKPTASESLSCHLR